MNPKSKKPRKQRRFAAARALHLAQQHVAGHLNKALRQELKKRALPVRTGDTVKVVRGQFSGKTGKIVGVQYKTGKITLEKIVRKKTDGKEVLIPIHASNVVLTELERKDEARFGQKPSKEKRVEKSTDQKKETKKEKAGLLKKTEIKKSDSKTAVDKPLERDIWSDDETDIDKPSQTEAKT